MTAGDGGAVKFFWELRAAMRSARELNLGSSTSAILEWAVMDFHIINN